MIQCSFNIKFMAYILKESNFPLLKRFTYFPHFLQLVDIISYLKLIFLFYLSKLKTN